MYLLVNLLIELSVAEQG